MDINLSTLNSSIQSLAGKKHLDEREREILRDLARGTVAMRPEELVCVRLVELVGALAAHDKDMHLASRILWKARKDGLLPEAALQDLVRAVRSPRD